jgi:hypothetical protein
MDAGTLLPRIEHLTPHDLVTYSRCPHEMELERARRASLHSTVPVHACTPPGVVANRHSPLFTPPAGHTIVEDGRLDLEPSDLLVYEDDGEDDLPVLFSPEHVRPDPRFHAHGENLVDEEWGLSGRPDLVVLRRDGTLFPIEYKSTHLFTGYHESHGRAFDLIQAIAECRLVHVATGRRPAFGVVLYGDVAHDGAREGWVRVPYGDAEEHWLKAALVQIRTDRTRAPVPAERNCAGCEANRDQLCPYAAARYEGPHRATAYLPMVR